MQLEPVRGAGGGIAGIRGLTAALDDLLRPALEAAVTVARVGEEATPAIPAPPPLRPFLQFAKLPARAVGAARRAVDSDDGFRTRVAEIVFEDDVGRAGWLWLTRPPGWEDELEDLRRETADAVEAAADRRAETDARRRLAGAEAATRRAEAAAAAASADAARAMAALAEERQARRVAAQETGDLTRRLQQVTAERDRARHERDGARDEGGSARRRIVALEAEVDELRRRPPEPPAPAPHPGPDPAVAAAAASAATAGAATATAAGALLGAASAAGAMAASLEAAAVALGADPRPPSADRPAAPPPPPPPPPPPAGASPPRRPRPPRRVPAPLPPGILDDSVEAADHLLRVPGMTLLVDGYNVSQTGWPDLAIAEQRRRLVDALTELATRTGVDVSVIFDGADPLWPPSVPAVSRLVRVSFSPAEVEADDVVLARVSDLDASRPVLVASSDRRVRDGAAGMGANIVSSGQLLAALRR